MQPNQVAFDKQTMATDLAPSIHVSLQIPQNVPCFRWAFNGPPDGKRHLPDNLVASFPVDFTSHRRPLSRKARSVTESISFGVRPPAGSLHCPSSWDRPFGPLGQARS